MCEKSVTINISKRVTWRQIISLTQQNAKNCFLGTILCMWNACQFIFSIRQAKLMLLPLDCREIFFVHFLLINTVGHALMTVVNFRTISNASDFNRLENLIGSFHRYAPHSAYLSVYDDGLTDGQRKLLSRYQNIEVLSSVHFQSGNVLTIDVEAQFVKINDTLYTQHARNKLNYIDSVHKRFYLAVVIPLIPEQLS